MKASLAVALGLTAALLASCSSGGTPPASPSPSPVGSGGGGVLTEVQLKLRLLAQLGELWYCDPDFYPVARADEQKLADERVPEIQRDKATFEAILDHLKLPPETALGAAQRLAVYRTWKQVNAIQLTPIGTAYRFDILVRPDPAKEEGRRVAGIIDDRGAIRIEQQAAAGPPPCPICLARGTPIATPDGPIPVEELKPGMAIWTEDPVGNRIAVVVEAVGSSPVPPTHRVVHLVLADGREVWVSPGHQLSDGRQAGDLQRGDRVDGSVTITAELVPYSGGSTFDVLPAGATAIYWANDIPLRSTLRP